MFWKFRVLFCECARESFWYLMGLSYLLGCFEGLMTMVMVMMAMLMTSGFGRAGEGDEGEGGGVLAGVRRESWGS